MKVRQRNLRIFEFDDDNNDRILDCIKNNFEIMQNCCLVFHRNISRELKSFLMDKKINFFRLNRDIVSSAELDNINIRSTNSLELDEVSRSCQRERGVVFARQIRSGEEIETKGDAFFLRNVHNGASIKCGGNLQIFGKCEANLEVLGDFIMIRGFCNGRISLQGCNIDQKILAEFNNNDVKYIYLDSSGIKIDRF